MHTIDIISMCIHTYYVCLTSFCLQYIYCNCRIIKLFYCNLRLVAVVLVVPSQQKLIRIDKPSQPCIYIYTYIFSVSSKPLSINILSLSCHWTKILNILHTSWAAHTQHGLFFCWLIFLALHYHYIFPYIFSTFPDSNPVYNLHG
jgi:hypothetical protein